MSTVFVPMAVLFPTAGDSATTVAVRDQPTIQAGGTDRDNCTVTASPP